MIVRIVLDMARRLSTAVVLVAGLVLAACSSGSGSHASDGKVTVVGNFYPVAEVAARVGGDRVRVTNLTPAGTEPHDLELTPKQVDELESADVVLYVGDGFQPAVADVAKRRDKNSIDVLDRITLRKGAADALGEKGMDPHFWLDPNLLATAADEAADGLAKADPPGAATYRANASSYKQTLATLDQEYKRGLASCQRKEIVTSHAAFFYLAERYGLTQLAVAGLSPEAEPDAARIATLTDRIKADGITTVFYEDLVSPAVARTLAREAGVATAVLSPIEGLTKAQVAAGKDYVAVMRDNLAALRKALGCA
jgi:zinc transport system substrate-binding protein